VAPEQLDALARLLVEAERPVIVWGEQLGDPIFPPLPNAKTLEVPSGTNSRGLREIGCVSNMGPGLEQLDEPGLAAAQARDAARNGDLGAFYLLHSDPLRELPGRPAWDEALAKANVVVAHSQFMNESIEAHADVVFPAEAYAEKEGTITHPDGRLQRVRPAIGHAGEVRPEWQVLVELGKRLGLELESHVSSRGIFEEIGAKVPLYANITVDDIGGDGLRWQERGSTDDIEDVVAIHFDATEVELGPESPAPLVLARRPNLWTKPECGQSPILEFLAPRQELLMHPADAAQLGLSDDDVVAVSSNGHRVEASVQMSPRAAEGVVYLFEGVERDGVNVLSANGTTVGVEIAKAERIAG
jgi:NADH-quinone oxidoreductase subunit G